MEEDQDYDEGFEEEDVEDDFIVLDVNFEVVVVRLIGKFVVSVVGFEVSIVRFLFSFCVVW